MGSQYLQGSHVQYKIYNKHWEKTPPLQRPKGHTTNLLNCLAHLLPFHKGPRYPYQNQLWYRIYPPAPPPKSVARHCDLECYQLPYSNINEQLDNPIKL